MAHTPCHQTVSHLCSPPLYSLIALCPSYVVAAKPAPSAGGAVTQHRAERNNHFPHLTWCSPVYSWPLWLRGHAASSDSRPRMPRSLFVGLLSTPSPATLYIPPGLPHPRRKSQHLLFFMQIGTILKFVQILVQGLSALNGVNVPPS